MRAEVVGRKYCQSHGANAHLQLGGVQVVHLLLACVLAPLRTACVQRPAWRGNGSCPRTPACFLVCMRGPVHGLKLPLPGLAQYNGAQRKKGKEKLSRR